MRRSRPNHFISEGPGASLCFYGDWNPRLRAETAHYERAGRGFVGLRSRNDAADRAADATDDQRRKRAGAQTSGLGGGRQTSAARSGRLTDGDFAAGGDDFNLAARS